MHVLGKEYLKATVTEINHDLDKAAPGPSKSKKPQLDVPEPTVPAIMRDSGAITYLEGYLSMMVPSHAMVALNLKPRNTGVYVFQQPNIEKSTHFFAKDA